MSKEISLESFGTAEGSLSRLHISDDDKLDLSSDSGSTQLSQEIEHAIVTNSEDVCDVVQQWLESNPQGVTARTDCSETALHLAAEQNNVQLAGILLNAGADPNLSSDTLSTVLHKLCNVDEDTDITELATLLLDKISIIDGEDEEKRTALALAASNGHLKVVQMLLDRGADMTIPDDILDTPVHYAARARNKLVVKEFIARNQDCVHLRGYNEETPLHQAVEDGHVETVQEILKAKPDVNARSKSDYTPLHCLATCGSVPIGKLLLEHGALVNPPASTEFTKSPFHKAAFYGQTDLSLFLLDKGAIVTAWAFQEIVREGFESIAEAVIMSPQWPVALRTCYMHKGKPTTPFRELIKKMPKIAEAVLNHCTVEKPGDVDRGDEEYSVVYNYEFIEDFLDGWEYGSDETDAPGEKKKKKKEAETYGCSYDEITDSSKDAAQWGPKVFKKVYHPMAIMVQRNRLNLLNHPVIGSLLHYKWKKFGQYIYFTNLFTYILFLIYLTSFALLVPNPQSPQCKPSTNQTAMDSTDCPGSTYQLNGFLISASVIVLLFAIIRLVVEFFQLVALKLLYVLDWVNWMENIQYISSIIFVVVYASNCFCVVSWQWQIGAIAVFLGWIDLIIFLSKLPFAGIYVIMFIKICKTFFTMAVLTLLLIIAFGLTFFMIFFDSTAERSPFSDAARSLLKTMTMTTGELDYDAIFRLDPSGESDDLAEIAYPPVSYILWIAFIILMPVLLTNMLVGLAVGDIDAVRKEAQLQKLALQVDQVLALEELLPKRWRRRLRTSHLEVFPNVKKSKLQKLGFIFWEGDRYDQSEVINTVLHPPKETNEEVLEKTTALAEEVTNIKQTLHRYQFLLEEIAKKNGIGTPQSESVSNGGTLTEI